MEETKRSFWDKVKAFFRYVHEEFFRFPTYILAHPLKGFEIFKREKKAKKRVAITYIVILVILNILSFQYSGFEVNFNEIRDLNSIAEIIYIVAPVILITVANWSVTTLFDGKGKMGEIFLMISYALFPLIWATGLGIILSNILTGEEIALYYLVLSIGAFLTGYMVFFGMISIHEYGLTKCLLTILFTLIAASVIIFIGLLFFGLFQRMYGFLHTIYREITLRNLI